jgi:endoglucanase
MPALKRTIAAFLLLAACGVGAPGAGGEAHADVVQLNQVGFLPDAGKHAVIVSESATPLQWGLYDAEGRRLAEGATAPFGMNAQSGQNVHRIDFGAFATPGAGYTVRVGNLASHPFDIAPDIYRRLKYDALAFFYHQRSGVEIEARFVGAAWARPAAHAPDRATCFTRDARGNVWSGCLYSLDASRGWYDAGDHGKYVVNAGVSLWTLMNYYERTRGDAARAAAFADGALAIPEQANGVSDLLDEIRWELDFVLAMQAPDGARLRLPLGNQSLNVGRLMFTEVDASGMAHHKIHDDIWTPLPTPPHLDRRPRLLSYPTTAATLNLAAVAAQCARIWRSIDADFSERCLQTARRAYAAARRVPNALAYNVSDGSGAYGDTRLDDEFYWAAVELYLSTGEAAYAADMRASPDWLATDDFSWARVATLGTMSLAVAGSGADQGAARARIVERATTLRAESAAQGYLIPFARSYVWGSNSDFANRGILLALAYDFTGDAGYRDEVVNVMDYMLGRNPLDRSYVSGYGERPVEHPHHRFWAHSLDANLPPPPPGALAGGSNNQWPADDVARRIHAQCRPQTCYADEVGAYSLNEVAINWNAPLFWIAAFLDEH